MTIGTLPIESLNFTLWALGPALTLLLAGPSLSLPAMLVIRSVLGNKKTVAYIAIVIVYSSIAGLIFGMI